MEEQVIETMNDSVVAVQGTDILIMRSRPRLTRGEALRLAAYIVALTDKDEFEKVYAAVVSA